MNKKKELAKMVIAMDNCIRINKYIWAIMFLLLEPINY